MRCADKRPGCSERLSDPKAEGEGGGGSGRPRGRPCTPLSASGLRLGRRRRALKMTESESDPISDMQLRTAAYKAVQDGRTPHREWRVLRAAKQTDAALHWMEDKNNK